MARGSRGGKPTDGDDRGGTRQIRVFEDLYEMIYWIQEVEGVASAELLDPLLRPQITARYHVRQAAIETLKKARSEQPSPPKKRRPAE